MQKFDNIYDKEIKKDMKYIEMKRLSKRKDVALSISAGRHFKLDLENRFLMFLM